MARLRFSGLLLRFVDYERTVASSAPDLGSALTEVESRFPRLRPVLRDDVGNLRDAHRVFVNGELAPDVNRATPLADSDEVEFLTAISGGG
ncbi:MoaD/ThiS family protein [Streptomyces sp. NBC_01789]|uniref:MoaD/ThiS family protein n=1 Tax=Streptomyces sp. NBC_01789 TaxID=2975941 RepID=UPI00224F099F|nr:MoaD/ThiS family protein [Streptomyces sp. NBC_01789]MCX4444838.1 MoaD/ThiS family protein [Streptomyces sp. NBC_01789]